MASLPPTPTARNPLVAALEARDRRAVQQLAAAPALPAHWLAEVLDRWPRIEELGTLADTLVYTAPWPPDLLDRLTIDLIARSHPGDRWDGAGPSPGTRLSLTRGILAHPAQPPHRLIEALERGTLPLLTAAAEHPSLPEHARADLVTRFETLDPRVLAALARNPALTAAEAARLTDTATGWRALHDATLAGDAPWAAWMGDPAALETMLRTAISSRWSMLPNLLYRALHHLGAAAADWPAIFRLLSTHWPDAATRHWLQLSAETRAAHPATLALLLQRASRDDRLRLIAAASPPRAPTRQI